MKLSVFTVLLFFVGQLPAQNFSGEITYRTELIPKHDSVDMTTITNNSNGEISTYLISNGFYKSTYYKNNKYSYSYTYHNETERMYDDRSEKDYITYRDSKKSNHEYHGSDVHRDSTLTVLGYDCFLVKRDASYGKSKTYYSDKVKVDYSYFEGHAVGNWYNSLKETGGALAIKSITEYKDHYEVREAIKIEERDVDSAEFDLPEKPIVSSMSALDVSVDMVSPSEDQIECYRQKVLAVSKENGTSFVVYISFVFTDDGQIKYMAPLEKDEGGLHKVALDIVGNCGFKLLPGQIDGANVSSEMYFPVEFLR